MENPIQCPDDQDDFDRRLFKVCNPNYERDQAILVHLPMQVNWRVLQQAVNCYEEFSCTERAEYDFINHHDPKRNETQEYINEYSKLVAISENLTKQTEHEYDANF